MTYAGHPSDPEPTKTLSERGLLGPALEWRRRDPCPLCVENAKWRLLTDEEARSMGVWREPGLDLEHTCHERNRAFWRRAPGLEAAEPERAPRDPRGWLEDQRRSP